MEDLEMQNAPLVEEEPLTQEEVNEGLEAFDEKVEEEVEVYEPTPKERLYNEITELSERIDKLANFLKRRDEDGVRVVVKQRLTDAAIYLLHQQLDIMQEYYNILCARYSIFDVKKVEGAVGLVSAVEIVE